MAMRLLGVGGVPGSGKSQLVSEILHEYGCNQLGQFGVLRFHRNSLSNLYVLGIYRPGDLFPGTDRLSMAVIGDAISFTQYVWKESLGGSENVNVLFEGDRLFCNRFLDKAWADEKRFYILSPSERVLKRNRERRNTQQSESFLRGRETKIHNMLKTRNDLMRREFDSELEFNRIYDDICDYITPF